MNIWRWFRGDKRASHTSSTPSRTEAPQPPTRAQRFRDEVQYPGYQLDATAIADHVVPKLLAGLSDEDSEVRQIAAGRIATFAANAPEAPNKLHVLLSDRAAPVRAAAATALRSFGDPALASVDALTDLLNEAEWPVRFAAAQTLSVLDPKHECIPVLIEGLSSDSQIEYSWAASALAHFGDRAAPAIPALVRAMKWEGPHDMQRDAGRVLSRLGMLAIPALSEALESDDKNVRIGAIIAIGEMGPKAAQASARIEPHLSSESKYTRHEAACAMVKLGCCTQKVKDVLLEDMTQMTLDVVEPLVAIGSDVREEVLARFTGAFELYRQSTKDEFAGPLWHTLIAGMRVLTRIDRDADEYGPMLVELATDKDFVMRRHAVSALSRVDLAPDLAGPVLVRALEDEDEIIKDAAARALLRIGYESERASECILDALHEPFDGDRRLSAIVSIETATSWDAHIESALVAALDDRDARVRLASAQVLCKNNRCIEESIACLCELATGEVPYLHEFIDEGRPRMMTMSKDPTTQSAAAALLGELGDRAASAREALEKATKSNDVSVQEAATHSLRKIGGDPQV